MTAEMRSVVGRTSRGQVRAWNVLAFGTSVLVGLCTLACGPSNVGVGGISKPNDQDPKGTGASPVPGSTTNVTYTLGDMLCTVTNGPHLQLFGVTMTTIRDKGAMAATPSADGGAYVAWHVCNDSVTVPLAAGSGYNLSATQLDPGPNGGPPVRTPVDLSAINPLTVPPLPTCTCFLEVVSINTSVPSAVWDQTTIKDLRNQGLVFPQISLGQGHKYYFELPSEQGVAPTASFSL